MSDRVRLVKKSPVGPAQDDSVRAIAPDVRNQPIARRDASPEAITTDGLRSYRAAMNDLGNAEKQEIGHWANNRAENSHQPFRRRERAMLRFRRMKTLQKFAWSTPTSTTTSTSNAILSIVRPSAEQNIAPHKAVMALAENGDNVPATLLD
ncbi:DDE-type integrase/transposase/recombinase [Sphingomonas naphthae]|uniref:DDE-type integrase/transposase/recombinase n=1 Tax=Sphingomonas naphthae TaxID=1813468 RepID=A0ABY7TGF6_9SPHN|nr:DDE-type integrase/transposase/recombinase [Sphingomonas naphthae]WCT72229.1 DDE-type integrase/transposase/recombinase [Sphingomonas naphthae]